MKILFITSTRIGDAILSTGALDHLIRENPKAEITVACGPLVAGLFAPAPGVTRVIEMKKKSYGRHWLELARETMGTRWDIVVDLRDSVLSRLLCAKKKCIWGRQAKDLHKVEQIAAVLGVKPPPAPRLWFDSETLAAAEKLVPEGGPVLAVGPAANWRGKTWPVQNFITLAGWLTDKDGILPGARVAVFAAPGEREIAEKLLEAVPERLRIDVIGKASPLLAAAAIKRCDFYVGNDSGLMHAAAAVGVPTLGLFGPSWPHLYRPWGPHCAYVATPENYDALLKTGIDGNHSSLMTTLTATAANEAAVRLWQSCR
ncbi:MAG: glycosyltransferase family 9 protein [Alphaproteobacteria bacterium]|nr:glycosyltransferase family 9 protein [Alphaproteobacteria bacterium]